MYPIPADSTVQRPPGRPTAPRSQPFKRVADPDLVVRSCLTLSSAFRQIYAGNAKDQNYETLYRCTYNVVRVGHGGEALYTQVATTMAAEVEKLAGSLDSTASAPDDHFLQELLSRWKTHSNAVEMISDVVIYMDRTFVLQRHKAPVSELGLRAWRDGMLRPDGGEVLGPHQDASATRARPGRRASDEGLHECSLPRDQEHGGRRRAVAVT
ncbi:cullin-3B-like [Lolium perenne]|uniref:cullin-3B-like n=1 Tax=Lolium perenne TaxID=4522 RepID=UPI0021F58B4C|nr:cullin-3B-like [Lolium perenne]